jgi:hypothetical protein
MTLRFEPVALADVPWSDLDALPDRTVCQRRPWLEFLAASQRARPVVAAVHDGPDLVAWFSGARIRRFGVPILGSPFRGWTTSYMGFNLVDPDADRSALVAALPSFAFRDLGCAHVEVMDRHLTAPPADGTWSHTSFGGWELDLRPPVDDLFAATTQSCRWTVRKAGRNGITVAEHEAPGFAALYHRQLTEVFARQGKRPPFPESRVAQLVDALPPEQRLLLVARRADGLPIATGFFVGSGHEHDPAGPAPGPEQDHTAYLWGMASTLADRHLYPNEAVMWAGITGWRERGATRFDFGGGGRFKAKFRGRPISTAWLRSSRWPVLERGRALAARAQARRTRLR